MDVDDLMNDDFSVAFSEIGSPESEDVKDEDTEIIESEISDSKSLQLPPCNFHVRTIQPFFGAGLHVVPEGLKNIVWNSWIYLYR